MEKVFKVADIRDLEQKVALGEMSYSRMVEVLNERAEEHYSKVKKLNEPAVMLSCPFCGGEPQLTFIGNDYSKKRKVEIKCKGCRVTMGNAGIRSVSEQLAKWSIEAWNKRVGRHGA